MLNNRDDGMKRGATTRGKRGPRRDGRILVAFPVISLYFSILAGVWSGEVLPDPRFSVITRLAVSSAEEKWEVENESDGAQERAI